MIKDAIAANAPASASLPVRDPWFEVAQPSVNDAGRAAGRTGREIVLLGQKRAPARPCTLPRNGDAVDSAADHKHVKALVLQRRSLVQARVLMRAHEMKKVDRCRL